MYNFLNKGLILRATISSSTVPLPPSETDDNLDSLSPPLSPVVSVAAASLSAAESLPAAAISQSPLSATKVSSSYQYNQNPSPSITTSIGRLPGPPAPKAATASETLAAVTAAPGQPPLVEEESLDSPDSPAASSQNSGQPLSTVAVRGIEALADFQVFLWIWKSLKLLRRGINISITKIVQKMQLHEIPIE